MRQGGGARAPEKETTGCRPAAAAGDDEAPLNRIWVMKPQDSVRLRPGLVELVLSAASWLALRFECSWPMEIWIFRPTCKRRALHRAETTFNRPCQPSLPAESYEDSIPSAGVIRELEIHHPNSGYRDSEEKIGAGHSHPPQIAASRNLAAGSVLD